MIYIGLIGPGLIGKQILRDIKIVGGLEVVGICNSKKFLIGNDPSINEWEEMENTNKYNNIVDCFVKKLQNKYNEKLIIVDCTASLEIARQYVKWLSDGINIVTPNKRAFSSEISLFLEIQNKRGMCYYESTVGAGLPIISTIKDIISSGDKVIKIEGILSGTLSYIFNKFCENKNIKFSEIIKIAKELGYTEPDPRDDLNGMDVGRKMIILCRLIGLEISIDDIYIENLVPIEIGEYELNKLDDRFEKMREDILNRKCVLRYVGIIEDNKCRVELKEYDYKHQFANLNGADNIIIIYTKRFKERPLVIIGAGAGAQVTSFGVLSDLIKIRDILEYNK